MKLSMGELGEAKPETGKKRVPPGPFGVEGMMQGYLSINKRKVGESRR